MKIDTLRLRITIGWLGMLLPWIVVILTGDIPPSISATWYTNACTPFMIILGSASILLMCYKGYEPIDDFTLTSAGIFGLLICLFPTDTSLPLERVGTFMLTQPVSKFIHYASAALFFLLLAYNSIFLFTKGSKTPTKKKKIRNIIYIICGIGMIASFGMLLLPAFPIKIWLIETIALFFFGLSFLTKADYYPWLFCDTPHTDE